MNLRFLLASIISIGTISAMVPSITKSINHQNQRQVNSTKDTIAEIAKKYESDDINVSIITLDNLWRDISANGLTGVIANAINITFDISKANSDQTTYIFYGDDRGNAMATSYAKAIKNQAIKLLECLPVLTLISDIAQFYGNNINMHPTMRKAAVIKTIALINGFLKWTQADGIYTSLTKGVFGDVANWSKNYQEIINNVLAKEYTKDPLLYQFNDINYDNLTTYNGNLHASDDKMVETFTNGVYNVDDWFCLGTSDNSQKIKIHLTTNFKYESYPFKTDFLYTYPWDFYITMHQKSD